MPNIDTAHAVGCPKLRGQEPCTCLGGKHSNPKDQAASTRLDLSLVPQCAIVEEALAMLEGDLKYGGYNYREAGVQVSVYIAAALRHIFKYYNGEDRDQKTTVHHLGNARACLGIILDGIHQGNINDDRPPRQDVGGLLDAAEGTVKHLQEIFPRRTPRYRAKKL